jgi:hypothetical protein
VLIDIGAGLAAALGLDAIAPLVGLGGRVGDRNMATTVVGTLATGIGGPCF